MICWDCDHPFSAHEKGGGACRKCDCMEFDDGYENDDDDWDDADDEDEEEG